MWRHRDSNHLDPPGRRAALVLGPEVKDASAVHSQRDAALNAVKFFRPQVLHGADLSADDLRGDPRGLRGRDDRVRIRGGWVGRDTPSKENRGDHRSGKRSHQLAPSRD